MALLGRLQRIPTPHKLAGAHRALCAGQVCCRRFRSVSCCTASQRIVVQANSQQAAAAAEPHDRQQTAESSTRLQLRVQAVSSIDQVSQQEWDELAASSGEVNPFLKWHFLHALEASGSAVKEQGWAPQHVTVRDDASGQLLGAAPMYLKSHSYGEYVFDHSWADFCSMTGSRYYPKLQCCVPFTPVTGPRLLVRGGPLKEVVAKALAQSLMAVADAMQVSSLHITFSSGEEWAALGALGFQQRRGIQFHWENNGYSSFEDFLAELKQPRRKSIRQERKGVVKQGLQVRRLTGHDVSAAQWDDMYSFYMATVDKKWGSAYLKREFFHMLGELMPDEVLLTVAEEAGGGPLVAGALNLAGSHALYGRNWGCLPGKEYKHLHFELCYYSAIEEAIERKLPRVEAGAQGEHKLQRGYLPNFTYSAHYIRDPMFRSAVGRFLEREATQLTYNWQQLTLQGSPFKDERTMAYLGDKASVYASLESASGSSLESADDA